MQALAALREKARCVIMYAGMIPYRNVFTQHLTFDFGASTFKGAGWLSWKRNCSTIELREF